MKLKELRKELGITQNVAAQVLGLPLRTYCRYEDEQNYENTFKYNQIMNILGSTQNKIIYSLKTIKKNFSVVAKSYPIDACYLFGSYAKSKATQNSDIDFMIVTGEEIEGMKFYAFANELEIKFHKKVDVIRLDAAIQNKRLLNEILKDGIKIYG